MGSMRLEQNEDVVRVVLSGSFRVEDAAKVKQGLLDALATAPRLVVDMTDMTGADLTFYQLLCAARRSAVLRGGMVETTGLTGKMLEAAKRYGLATVLEDRCQ